MKYLVTVLLFLCFFYSQAQDNNDQINYPILKPVLALQTWADYTIDHQVWQAQGDNGGYEPVDNHLGFQLRRSRFGLKGAVNERLTFNLTAAYDFVGRDRFSSTVGGSGTSTFSFWNAYVSYKLSANSEAFNISFGYMPPQISRESITSALRVNSFEKSWSQNYIRRFTVGIGPGRSMGLNLGGFLPDLSENLALSYHVGIFNGIRNERILFNDFSTNPNAPMFAGRLALHIGDPEFKSYSLTRKVNFNDERNGVTFAASGSYQGKTLAFDQNYSFGFDILANYGPLNISGEWMLLKRSRDSWLSATGETTINTGFFRIGYNLEFKSGIWEPVFMYVLMEGAKNQNDQDEAMNISTFYGSESYFDLSLNFYPDKYIKLTLNTTIRSGEAGYYNDATEGNNYFFQNDQGAIKRGNMIALGVVFIL